jgi:ribonucleoside-triphosphate reductase
MTIETPWSSIGYITYKRTYARRLTEGDANSATEEFKDTVGRVVNAANNQLGCGFDAEEQARLEKYLLELKGTVAGRFLWQLGTSTVDRLGLASLQNCAFTVVDDPVRPFTWAMDLLMLGSGVGYNIQRKNVDKLPVVNINFTKPERLDSTDADFIVPDSREGWVKLLGKTLKAAFLSDKSGSFSYSTINIRGKGAPIKGFGGTASGAEILCQGIDQISDVLSKRAGKKIRPVDALDIMNIIGSIVVAGNVRRSAQIAIGDPDDVEYLLAKRWDMGNIPSWRAMSNNSVVCNDIGDLHEYFWDGYEGKGEPYGLINLRLSRKEGRLGDTAYPDPDVQGYNPCAEQSLANFETCCLAEIYLPNVTSFDEFVDISTLLYRINKHSLNLPCHLPETEAIVHKNMRMGIGVTGYLQATEEQKGWLAEAYKKLRVYDQWYSAKNEFNKSIKLTTVKPSGTLSLLPGVTPGAHPGYSQHMIRRIRIASNHALVDVCRQNGYDVEYQMNFDGSEDHSTVVVSFPFAFPEGTRLAAEMTAIDQLEVVKRLQKDWSDNSVSCTIYYRKEELPEIRSISRRTTRTTTRACRSCCTLSMASSKPRWKRLARRSMRHWWHVQH